jgi:hypothetical protein
MTALVYYSIHNCLYTGTQLLPDRRGGRPESSLSLRSHGGGPPPPPGPGEGDVITPYSWSIAGTTVASLLRGTGGFLTIRERASTPPFTQEVLVAGALSAAAFAGGIGGMDLGA